MDTAEFHPNWTRIGKIYSAEARVFLNHGWGILTIEITYVQEEPTVAVCVEFLSADLERNVRTYAIPLEYVLSLLSQVAGLGPGRFTPKSVTEQAQARSRINSQAT